MVCGIYRSYSIWYINIRILQTMVSRSPLRMALGTRMRNPYVYVVFWPEKHAKSFWNTRNPPTLHKWGIQGIYHGSFKDHFLSTAGWLFTKARVCITVEATTFEHDRPPTPKQRKKESQHNPTSVFQLFGARIMYYTLL